MVDDELESRIRAACVAERWDDALTIAFDGYGTELMSYLVALTRNAADADDVFATMCENLWRRLPAFRWDSSFRTYAYTAARNTFLKLVRGRRSTVPLSSPAVAAVVGKARSQTETFLRTETKDKLAQIREQLDPEDQTLLILRVSRQMAWRDIAAIMLDEETSEHALDRRAAALRKRFERLKDELRDKLDLNRPDA